VTDRHTTTAYTVLSIASHGKNDNDSQSNEDSDPNNDHLGVLVSERGHKF